VNPGVLAGIIAGQVARMVVRQRGGGNKRPGQQGIAGSWGAFVWFVLVPTSLPLLVGVLAGQLYLLPLLLAIGLLTFPWPIARLVLIPLGLPRLAYFLTWTSDYTFHLDRQGGAALAGAWALVRQPKLDEAAAEWIAQKLAQGEVLRGAGVFASGLLLAARGDLDGARALIESVHDLDPRASPPALGRFASSWLAADAAARGDWLRVGELGLRLGDSGREAWLLSAVAQTLRFEPMAPGRLGLWLRWAIAPHRSKTLPIVRRALAALDGAFVEPEADAPRTPTAPAHEGDDFSTALSLHASLLRRSRGAVKGDEVRALSHAWDVVLSDRVTERGIEARALVLGASGPKPALDRLRGAIEEDIVAVVLAADLSLSELGAHSATAERVRRGVRDRLLSEVEAMADAIRRRADERRELPAIDEWREWNALHRAYARGVRLAGQDFRRLAFHKVHPDACSLAVWLFNDRKQRPLGNAIFRFLLTEAEAIDDPRAIALQTKNVGCGV
jgi:hypothetical protein